VSLDEIKIWVNDNKKGLIVGVIAGFVISRLLK
jgi:uncharacterized membrane-anchored protein YhcB (DUF1043 family)